jgi:hypothetical protein
MHQIALFIILSVLLVIGTYFVTSSYLGNQVVAGTQELLLNAQDLQQLGMTSNTDCQTEEQTSIYSSQVQYSICNYTINSLNDTWVVLELKKFTNLEDRNGTYQYESSHLFSVQGLMSENDYGDQSRFRVNNVNDYGGQYNEPGVYYYHLWICKNEYLIHITSKGRSKEAVDYIAKIGRQILSKFG